MSFNPNVNILLSFVVFWIFFIIPFPTFFFYSINSFTLIPDVPLLLIFFIINNIIIIIITNALYLMNIRV